MLSWENVGKTYGRRRLFSGLSGQIEAGGGIVVTGANGSGKSTFLKILAGLTRPDAGRVNRSEERNQIGYAAPHLSLYGELTGLENVAFYTGARGLRLEAGAALDLLNRLGLGRAASRPASVYSTGMTQRLRLACALAHDPPLLLLDEPTIGLDAAGVALVERIVAERTSSKIGGGRLGAAVVASNDPEQCARFGDAGWSLLALDS